MNNTNFSNESGTNFEYAPNYVDLTWDTTQYDLEGNEVLPEIW